MNCLLGDFTDNAFKREEDEFVDSETTVVGQSFLECLQRSEYDTA